MMIALGVGALVGRGDFRATERDRHHCWAGHHGHAPGLKAPVWVLRAAFRALVEHVWAANSRPVIRGASLRFGAASLTFVQINPDVLITSSVSVGLRKYPRTVLRTKVPRFYWSIRRT